MLGGVNSNQGQLWQPVSNKGKGTNQNFSSIQGSNEPRHLKIGGDVLVSAFMRLPGGGTLNAHVFKADSFTSENPVMRVKGTNTDGSPFDVEININDLSKNNMSFIEMFALDGYITANTGQTSGIARAAGQALFNSNEVIDGFTQLDIVPALKEALAMHRQNGNWEAVVWMDSILDKLMNHFAQDR